LARLTLEQKWQIFLEASRKITTDAEVCRRWGIAQHRLGVIRERAKDTPTIKSHASTTAPVPRRPLRPAPDAAGEAACRPHVQLRDDQRDRLRQLRLGQGDRSGLAHENLSGIPDDEGLWTENLNHNWGTGSPGSIAGNDTWVDPALRVPRRLELERCQVRGVAGHLRRRRGARRRHRGVMDCVSATAGGNPIVNCGLKNPPKMKLVPGTTGLVPITIEFAEETGSAQLRVEWRLDNGGWNVVPLANLEPNLGLKTSKIAGPDWTQPTKTDLQLKTIWTYPGDNDKARRIPQARTLRDLTTGIERKTELAYDDYGRRTHITNFAGTADAAETIRTFTDSVNNEISCMTKVVDPTGAETNYVCNESSDVIENSCSRDQSQHRCKYVHELECRGDPFAARRRLD
jgi:hypothetical protein